MASNNQERCIYLIPPAVYNDRRERDVYSLEIQKNLSARYKINRITSIFIIAKEGNDRN
jgi:hypothetical protein